MKYTVAKLAKLAGISPRTLRFYDEIGLLQPVREENGYRTYGKAEVDRLQQILFYREAGLELSQIAEILNSGGFNAAQAMQNHLQSLKQRRCELDSLIATAEKTLQSLEGGKTMNDKEKFEGFKQSLIEENEANFGAEIREKYGENTVAESNAKMMNMTQEQYAEFEQLGKTLNEAIAAAVKNGDPNSEPAQKAAALHKQWLCCTWNKYTPEAHRGLAEMYIADERFTAYYDAIAPGAAQLLHDAVFAFTEKQL